MVCWRRSTQGSINERHLSSWRLVAVLVKHAKRHAASDHAFPLADGDSGTIVANGQLGTLDGRQVREFARLRSVNGGAPAGREGIYPGGLAATGGEVAEVDRCYFGTTLSIMSPCKPTLPGRRWCWVRVASQQEVARREADFSVIIRFVTSRIQAPEQFPMGDETDGITATNEPARTRLALHRSPSTGSGSATASVALAPIALAVCSST